MTTSTGESKGRGRHHINEQEPQKGGYVRGRKKKIGMHVEKNIEKIDVSATAIETGETLAGCDLAARSPCVSRAERVEATKKMETKRFMQRKLQRYKKKKDANKEKC